MVTLSLPPLHMMYHHHPPTIEHTYIVHITTVEHPSGGLWLSSADVTRPPPPPRQPPTARTSQDLTQSVWGFSRDDAIKFIGRYQKEVGPVVVLGVPPRKTSRFPLTFLFTTGVCRFLAVLQYGAS